MLLSLIEERKMLISDVSLAQVADDFLTFISEQNTYPVADTAQFIVVAATLLLIKSRALLPVLELTTDEEGDIHDLEKRLQLLSYIRAATQEMSASARRFIAPGITIREPLFVPPPDMSLASLHDGIESALRAAPQPVVTKEVAVAHVVSLDEMIERLTERVQRAISLSFSDFTKGATTPQDIVVGFLAMLELVKRGFANVSQGEHFEEITIEYTGDVSAPRYE
jgi:segregation and condensation protein A